MTTHNTTNGSNRTENDAPATGSPAPGTPRYRAPKLIAVGNAVDLLQSYMYGAYEDSYTGYKWNR
jgi:hypothetical protein